MEETVNQQVGHAEGTNETRMMKEENLYTSTCNQRSPQLHRQIAKSSRFVTKPETRAEVPVDCNTQENWWKWPLKVVRVDTRDQQGMVDLTG